MVLKGKHVLFGLLGAFGVVVAVNGAFVFFAASTFPGNETDDPYRRGLAYNDTLAADQQQRAAGWRAEVSLIDRGILLDLRNEASGPVAGLTVTGELRRPGDPAMDRTLRFVEDRLGRYIAPVVLEPGRWQLTAVAAAGNAAPLVRLRETIEVEGER